MDRKRKKQSGRRVVLGLGLCLSLAVAASLYLGVAQFDKPGLQLVSICFAGAFFLLMLVCAFIVWPQRRHLGAVFAGVLLLVFGSLSSFLHEFFELPELLPSLLEGLPLTAGALVTAVGLWRWTKHTSEQAATNKRLLEEERSQRRQMEALGRFSTNIVGLLGDRDILLQGLADRARKLIGVDAVCIRLADGGGGGGVRVAYAGRERCSDLKAVKAEIGMTGGEVRSAEGVIISLNAGTDSRIPRTYRGVLDKIGARSFFRAPLRVGQQLIGTIDGITEDARVFGPQEVETMTAFADRAAMTIANADLLLEIKQDVTELERLNQDLQQADRLKSEFVAAMSHEVRTPLNVIVGYAGLFMERLGSGASTADREAFRAVYEQSQVLSKVVTEVLQMAKVDTGKATLDVCVFPLREVVRELHTLVDGVNQDAGLEVVWDVDDEIPPMNTDRYKLAQVLESIVRNAFEYTTEGTLRIAVHQVELEDRVVFTVADTGVGIAEADLHRVFEPFYRGRALRRDGSQGTGLGLSIAKKYTELMEGNIHVESEWNVGTTFTVILPRVVSMAPDASRSSILPS